MRFYYTSSEHFTNEFVTAIAQGRADEFRRRYRQMDVLLIDDIQFLGGKERTQEEFFYTFNDLEHAGASVVITSDQPPEQVAVKLDWIRGLAREQGRSLRFGLRVHTISRDTSEAAWRHAQWLLDGLDPERVRAAQAALRASESTGQARMVALRGDRTSFDSARELEVSPGLWSGVGLVRGGALVGDLFDGSGLAVEYDHVFPGSSKSHSHVGAHAPKADNS